MPFPLLALAGLVVKCVCGAGAIGGTCYCVKKITDAYKKGQKTKQQSLGLKKEVIQKAHQDKEKAEKEKEELRKKYEDLDKTMKSRDQEIKKIKDKLKNPNLSPEEKKRLQNQLTILTTQQDEDQKEKDRLWNEIEKLNKRIKDSNQT